MALSAQWKAVAQKLQEQAAAELSASDLCRWLSDACRDMAEDGDYVYYIDHIGDSESGDVVYCCNGDMWKAPYTITQVNGKPFVHVDDEKAVDVLPRTTYEPQVDDADHYASMESAGLYKPGTAKLAERFISKDERDKADAGSFAGKGKSFPILKAGDVKAAVASMGRAGDKNLGSAALKRNIIAIAKKKGLSSELPDSWKDDSTAPSEAADVELTGDVIPLKEGAVGQDGTAYLKLIAPGRGSSGWYPEEVLERDGPKVFKSGTKNFWNHQTDAEEAARPEGDLRDLASVLTEDAHYDKAGPAGPGLYARAKVFEHYRAPVDQLAKHIGMSIRASGKAKEGKAPDGKAGPIIEQLTRGLSVDYVTTPGAGGQILQLFEAARHGAVNLNEGGADDMDAAEIKKLQESNRRLAQRVARTEAREAGQAVLAGIRLPDDKKLLILERAVQAAPLNAEGDLDNAAFKTLLEAEIKHAADLIGGGPLVTGMGGGADHQPTADELKTQEAETKAERKRLAETMGFGKDRKAGRKIILEGRGAFDPTYNSSRNGVGVTVED
jgi:hypothetical protein